MTLATDWSRITAHCIFIFNLISVHLKLMKGMLHAYKVTKLKKNATLRNQNTNSDFYVICRCFIQGFVCLPRHVSRNSSCYASSSPYELLTHLFIPSLWLATQNGGFRIARQIHPSTIKIKGGPKSSLILCISINIGYTLFPILLLLDL